MNTMLNIFTESFYRSIVQKNMFIINLTSGGIIVANLLDIKKIHHFTEERFRNFKIVF